MAIILQKNVNKTQKLKALDRRYVWHPFTQMQDWLKRDFLIIESGRGSYLKDTHGKRYLDGVSSLWCNMHGHGVRSIDRALHQQLSKVAHSTFLGLSNVPAIKLSEQLIRLAPRGLRKVFYSDSGSASVEIALKIAYQYWQQSGHPHKTMFLRFSNAYHGDTLGSVSVGGIDLFHRIFSKLLFKSYKVQAPDRYHEGFEGSDKEYARVCAKRVEKVLKRRAKSMAAIVMEPLVQGAAGMLRQPPGFLKRMRELADRYNVLLILDEVATGFGRTGKMFACEHERVRPDILCLAKGLTAGYLPLAATLTTDRIYKAFLGPREDFKAFFHGHTYTANPLACAAALANLAYFKEKRVLTHAQALIRELRLELKRFRAHPQVGDVRQVGLMVGIELIQKSGKPFRVTEFVGTRICERARKYGVIIRPLGNVLILMPPFSFSPKQIRTLCRNVYRAMQDVL